MFCWFLNEQNISQIIIARNRLCNQLKFSLFCLNMLCFCSVFHLSCHLFEMVFIPPFVGGDVTGTQAWTLHHINWLLFDNHTYTVCHHPLPCNASACYPSNVYVMYNTYQFPIIRDSLTPPPEMRKLYHLLIQFTPIIVKSNTECDNVLFIHCKLPIKVLPSICSAFSIKHFVKQFSVLWNTHSYQWWWG